VDFDLDGFRELAAEVLNVDAGATINKGWVLSGHQTDAQRSLRDEFHLTVFPGMQYLIAVTGFAGSLKLPSGEGWLATIWHGAFDRAGLAHARLGK
jgi:hypothetical protein